MPKTAIPFLRVRHEITGTIGRDDFGASQGAKSAHTGSMEAMSDAGGAQKRPALRGGPSLARGSVAPRSQSPARLSRRALPRSQIWASQLSRLFRDGPLAHLAKQKNVSSPPGMTSPAHLCHFDPWEKSPLLPNHRLLSRVEMTAPR